MTWALALGGRSNGDRLSTAYAFYATLLLTLVNIVNFIDRMIFAVLIEPIKKDLHLSDTQMGVLGGFAFVAVYAAMGVPLARLADRAGRRWVLAGSVALWSLTSAACGTAHSFSRLALMRLGVGMGEAGYMPSAHALLAEIYPHGRRSVPIAIVTSGAAAGIALGLTIGGVVASRYGWRAAFILVGLPGLLLAVLISLTLPEKIHISAGTRSRVPFWPTVRALYAIRTYRWTTFAHPLYLFVTAGTLTWLPAFFMRSHGLTLAQVGLYFGMTFGFGVALGSCLGSYALQRITGHAPARTLYLAGWLALGAYPCFVGALLVSSASLSLLLLMLFGALIAGAGPPMIAGQQGVVGDEARALASALSMLFSSYLGAGLGPFLIGAGSEKLVPVLGTNALRALLLFASSAIILTGLCLIRASKSLDADAKH